MPTISISEILYGVNTVDMMAREWLPSSQMYPTDTTKGIVWIAQDAGTITSDSKSYSVGDAIYYINNTWQLFGGGDSIKDRTPTDPGGSQTFSPLVSYIDTEEWFSAYTPNGTASYFTGSYLTALGIDTTPPPFNGALNNGTVSVSNTNPAVSAYYPIQITNGKRYLSVEIAEVTDMPIGSSVVIYGPMQSMDAWAGVDPVNWDSGDEVFGYSPYMMFGRSAGMFGGNMAIIPFYSTNSQPSDPFPSFSNSVIFYITYNDGTPIEITVPVSSYTWSSLISTINSQLPSGITAYFRHENDSYYGDHNEIIFLVDQTDKIEITNDGNIMIEWPSAGFVGRNRYNFEIPFTNLIYTGGSDAFPTFINDVTFELLYNGTTTIPITVLAGSYTLSSLTTDIGNQINTVVGGSVYVYYSNRTKYGANYPILTFYCSGGQGNTISISNIGNMLTEWPSTSVDVYYAGGDNLYAVPYGEYFYASIMYFFNPVTGIPSIGAVMEQDPAVEYNYLYNVVPNITGIPTKFTVLIDENIPDNRTEYRVLFDGIAKTIYSADDNLNFGPAVDYRETKLFTDQSYFGNIYIGQESNNGTVTATVNLFAEDLAAEALGYVRMYVPDTNNPADLPSIVPPSCAISDLYPDTINRLTEEMTVGGDLYPAETLLIKSMDGLSYVQLGGGLPMDAAGVLTNDGAGNLSWSPAPAELPADSAGVLTNDGVGNITWSPVPSGFDSSSLISYTSSGNISLSSAIGSSSTITSSATGGGYSYLLADGYNNLYLNSTGTVSNPGTVNIQVAGTGGSNGTININTTNSTAGNISVQAAGISTSSLIASSSVSASTGGLTVNTTSTTASVSLSASASGSKTVSIISGNTQIELNGTDIILTATSGDVKVDADPLTDLGVATKQYVDNNSAAISTHFLSETTVGTVTLSNSGKTAEIAGGGSSIRTDQVLTSGSTYAIYFKVDSAFTTGGKIGFYGTSGTDFAGLSSIAGTTTTQVTFVDMYGTSNYVIPSLSMTPGDEICLTINTITTFPASSTLECYKNGVLVFSQLHNWGLYPAVLNRFGISSSTSGGKVTLIPTPTYPQGGTQINTEHFLSHPLNANGLLRNDGYGNISWDTDYLTQTVADTLYATKRIAYTTLTSSGGGVTIDLTQPYEVYNLTLTENVSYWYINSGSIPSGYARDITVNITQGNPSIWTCVDPATPGRTAGGSWVVDSNPGAVESLSLRIYDNGIIEVYPSGVFG